MYYSEKNLVEHFIDSLTMPDCPWGKVNFAEEFFYQRGRTDIVAITIDNIIIAIEAKLTRWRDALHQAYRNTCFAHESYILLPEDVVPQALNSTAEFVKRGVGICYLSDNRINIAHKPIRQEPIQQSLASKAINYVTGVEFTCTES